MGSHTPYSHILGTTYRHGLGLGNNIVDDLRVVSDAHGGCEMASTSAVDVQSVLVRDMQLAVPWFLIKWPDHIQSSLSSSPCRAELILPDPNKEYEVWGVVQFVI